YSYSCSIRREDRARARVRVRARRRRSLGIVRVAALLLVLLAATSARADLTPDASYSALPCRPTIACTADFVPPGVVELELGYIFRRLAGDVNQSSLPFLLKVTLVEWAQLQVGSNGATFENGMSYFDDLTAGLKLRLHEQSAYAPSISLSATLSV